MVERISLDNARQVKSKEKVVKKLKSISLVNDKKGQNDKEQDFRSKLKRIKGQKKEIVGKDEIDNRSVVVSESLANLLEENRIMGELVHKRFISNPKIRRIVKIEELIINNEEARE